MGGGAVRRKLCLVYKQNIGKTSLFANIGHLRCMVPAWGYVNRGCMFLLLLTETPSRERMGRGENLTSCAKSLAQGLAGNTCGPLLLSTAMKAAMAFPVGT